MQCEYKTSQDNRLAMMAGLAAASCSAAVLLWRGRGDAGSAAAPLNAVSHWLWPTEALQRDDVSVERTGTGVAIHIGSSLLWGWVFAQLHRRHARPTTAEAIIDAAAVTGIAAAVDLGVVPKRLSPGFEERLGTRSLAWVYTAFGVGLAVAGICDASRR